MTKPIIFSLNISQKYKKFNNAETKVIIRQIQILKPKTENGNKRAISIFWSTSREYYFNIL